VVAAILHFIGTVCENGENENRRGTGGYHMTKAYEFHDSRLIEFMPSDEDLLISLRAVLLDWPEGLGIGRGTSSIQGIRMLFSNASVDGGFTTLPVSLDGGEFIARMDLLELKDWPTEFIPASVSSAQDVEVRFEGTEQTGEFHKCVIRADSVRIERFGPAKFVQEFNEED
jgi:hypothetical protein